MTAVLVPLSARYRASYVEALREGFRRGDEPATEEAAIRKIDADFVGFIAERTDQTGMVRLPNGREIPKVPFAMRWLVEGDTFIGEAGIRYRLNDTLMQTGGHVGYGIRPSRQRQGHGKLILKLALDELRRHDIERALVTCLDHNLASAKVIEANGGVLENIVDDPYGRGHTRRYWIDLR